MNKILMWKNAVHYPTQSNPPFRLIKYTYLSEFFQPIINFERNIEQPCVKDKYFQWVYPCSVKQGDAIATRISELATEWRTKIQVKLKGKLISIALDGWTDSISGNHHVCILLWTGEDLFYWESKVMTSKTSESIYNELSIVCSDIISSGGKIVA